MLKFAKNSKIILYCLFLKYKQYRMILKVSWAISLVGIILKCLFDASIVIVFKAAFDHWRTLIPVHPLTAFSYVIINRLQSFTIIIIIIIVILLSSSTNRVTIYTLCLLNWKTWLLTVNRWENAAAVTRRRSVEFTLALRATTCLCFDNYTVNHKKRDILFLTITLANLNRFS